MNYVVRVADEVVLCRGNLDKVYGQSLDFVIAIADSKDALRVAKHIKDTNTRKVQEDIIQSILGENTQVIPKPLSSLDLNELSRKIPVTKIKKGLKQYLDGSDMSEDLVTMIYEVTTNRSTGRKLIKKGEHIEYITNAVEASKLPIDLLDYLGTDEVIDLLDKRITFGDVASPLNITSFFTENTGCGEGKNAIYVDGSVPVVGKSQAVGIGVTLTNKEGKCKSYSFEVTHMPKTLVNPNNLELLALMLGTRVGCHYFGDEGFTLYSDSLYTLLSLYTYDFKHDFGKLDDIVQSFIQQYRGMSNLEFCKVKSHVGVLGNEMADFSAKLKSTALDINTISNYNVDIDFDKYEISTYLLEQQYAGRA